jgi:hypothetical protein
MRKRILRLLLAATIATAGSTAIIAAPAFAVGGCTPMSTSPTLGACFDYPGASNARADFYLNVAPDWSRNKYTVQMRVNSTWHTLTSGLQTFGTASHYCCWYRHVLNEPKRWQTGLVRVNVYTAANSFHYSVDSPVISFYA